MVDIQLMHSYPPLTMGSTLDYNKCPEDFLSCFQISLDILIKVKGYNYMNLYDILI